MISRVLLQAVHALRGGYERCIIYHRNNKFRVTMAVTMLPLWGNLQQHFKRIQPLLQLINKYLLFIY